MDGVMIFSPYRYAIACRKGEDIVVYKESFIPNSFLSHRFLLSRLPFLRGILAFLLSLSMSLRAYFISAKLASERGLIGKIFLNFLLAFLLLLLLPDLLSRSFFPNHFLLGSIFEALLRIVLLISFLLIFSLSPSGKRLLQYHGAEHKTINGFEDEAELTPEGLQSYPTIHIRCGTILFALALLLLFFLYLPFQNLVLPLRLFCKTLLFPLSLPIAFELVYLALRDERFHFLLVPGIFLQLITTKQPTREQLEVAIAALKEVVGIA